MKGMFLNQNTPTTLQKKKEAKQQKISFFLQKRKMVELKQGHAQTEAINVLIYQKTKQQALLPVQMGYSHNKYN